MLKCMLLLEHFEGFRAQKVHCLGLLHKNDIDFLESECLVVGFWFGLFHQHLSLTGVHILLVTH